MSDNDNIIDNTIENTIDTTRHTHSANSAHSLKEILIFSAWILAVLLLGFSMWFFTDSLRARILRENVNAILIDRERTPFLGEPLRRLQRGVPLGNWYEVRDTNDMALVFTIMSSGIRYPGVALISDIGAVTEIIFLNRRAEIMIGEGIIEAYIDRIEQDALFKLGGL